MKKGFITVMVLAVVLASFLPVAYAADVVLEYSQVTIDANGLLSVPKTPALKTTTAQTLVIPASFNVGGNIIEVKGIADSGFLAQGSIKGPVVISEGIESIGASAFQSCTLIPELTIPSTVESIGAQAFMTTSALKTFIVGAGNTNFTANGNVLYTADGKELVAFGGGDSTITDFIIPEGVEIIRAGAIRQASYITYMEFPSTLKNIDTSGVYSNNALTELKFKSMTAPSIHTTNFISVPSNKVVYTVYYPAGGTGYDAAAFINSFSSGAYQATFIPYSDGGSDPVCPITSLTSNGTGYDVEFEVPASVGEGKYIILAVYDASGNLIGVEENVDVSEDEIFIETSGKTAAKAKLMVWESRSDITPQVEVIPYIVD